MKPQIYNMMQAERLGYVSITVSYSNTCETEQKYLRNVLNDMKTVDHCLIETPYGMEVGRPKKDLL